MEKTQEGQAKCDKVVKLDKLVKYKYASVNIKNISKFITTSEDDSLEFETFIPPMNNFKLNIEFITLEYKLILINYLKHIIYDGEIPDSDITKIKQHINNYMTQFLKVKKPYE
jgi:hypothetical protein